jgi:hypothetical protein
LSNENSRFHYVTSSTKKVKINNSYRYLRKPTTAVRGKKQQREQERGEEAKLGQRLQKRGEGSRNGQRGYKSSKKVAKMDKKGQQGQKGSKNQNVRKGKKSAKGGKLAKRTRNPVEICNQSTNVDAHSYYTSVS